MKQTCETYIEWIKDEIAGELSTDRQQQLEAHVEQCGSCSQERLTLKSLAAELRRLGEEPVPRHFYVFDEPSETTRWWQGRRALAAAATLFVVTSALFITQTNVTITEGATTITWGQPSSLQPEQDQALKQEMLTAFRQVAVEENTRLAASLRSEFLQVLKDSEIDRDEQLRKLVSATEDRLSEAIQTGDEEVQAELEDALLNLYRTIAFQRQQDLTLINRRINNLAAIDQVQAEQTDTMMAAMIELASNRNQ